MREGKKVKNELQTKEMRVKDRRGEDGRKEGRTQTGEREKNEKEDHRQRKQGSNNYASVDEKTNQDTRKGRRGREDMYKG